MIGIIGAMDIEVENLIQKLSDKNTNIYSGITYTTGKYNKADVVVAKCGMGKVSAAMCAQTMLLMYSPRLIINTGVAGAISPKVKVGDIVIGENMVQHDMDLSPIGLEKGLVPEIDSVLIPSNITDKLENAVKKTGYNYYTGVIATGDQFINSSQIKDEILTNFNALACEMEGASIAQVCFLNNIDFGIIRTISDNADDDSSFDFNEFLQESAERSIRIVLEFLGGM